MDNRLAISMLLLGGLIGLGYWVVKPFLVSVAWAGILAVVTWPVYRRLRQPFDRHPNLAALTMTTALFILLLVPVSWLLFHLQGELADAYKNLSIQFSDRSPAWPDWLSRVPVFGPSLHDLLASHLADSSLWKRQLTEWIEPLLGEVAGLMGQIGRNAMQLGVTAVTLFFLYRDGDGLLLQIRRGLFKVLAERIDVYFRAAGETARAVVNGLILSAIVQGVVAGIGFWLLGAGAPVLLAALTAIASLIPFIGTLLIWGPTGAWLILTGHVWNGVGLLVWGAFLVHPTDNVLRPILISNASDTPLPIVLFGVIGGMLAFGMVGLFVGPMILAVLLAIWREWLGDDQTPTEDSGPARRE